MGAGGWQPWSLRRGPSARLRARTCDERCGDPVVALEVLEMEAAGHPLANSTLISRR